MNEQEGSGGFAGGSSGGEQHGSVCSGAAIEKAYTEGGKAAWRMMLGQAIREVAGDPQASAAAERFDAIRVLRRACEAHGSNEWPDSLHLGDVIEKHLERQIQERERKIAEALKPLPGEEIEDAAARVALRVTYLEGAHRDDADVICDRNRRLGETAAAANRVALHVDGLEKIRRDNEAVIQSLERQINKALRHLGVTDGLVVAAEGVAKTIARVKEILGAEPGEDVVTAAERVADRQRRTEGAAAASERALNLRDEYSARLREALGTELPLLEAIAILKRNAASEAKTRDAILQGERTRAEDYRHKLAEVADVLACDPDGDVRAAAERVKNELEEARELADCDPSEPLVDVLRALRAMLGTGNLAALVEDLRGRGKRLAEKTDDLRRVIEQQGDRLDSQAAELSSAQRAIARAHQHLSDEAFGSPPDTDRIEISPRAGLESFKRSIVASRAVEAARSILGEAMGPGPLKTETAIYMVPGKATALDFTLSGLLGMATANIRALASQALFGLLDRAERENFPIGKVLLVLERLPGEDESAGGARAKGMSKIVDLIRRFEDEARQDEFSGAPGYRRGHGQGLRDVCFALRATIGISKISDLPDTDP
jgi:hypothetical protein